MSFGSKLGSMAHAVEVLRSETLSELDAEILDFERHWWRHAGKVQEIRERFDMSAVRYYQQLNALLDRPEALAYDPLLVKRLRRLREGRQKSRSAQRLTVRG